MLALADLLNFKHKSCVFNSVIEEKIDYNYINLYVKITEKCNAKCSFCEYYNNKSNFKFDICKFEKLIGQLTKEHIHIHKISFTGGETTLAFDILHKCFNVLKRLKHKPFIVVNSNGNYLQLIIEEPFIDNISLSRHAIDDILCEKIANSKIKKAKDIKNIISNGTKNKVHLTCNLIKGYVQDEKSIVDYLEFAKSLGVYDVGFVSLMKINDFCKRNHVDFSDITFNNRQIVCNKEWTYKDICKCKNFLYLPNTGNKVVKFYSRYRCKNEEDSESNYVFDGTYLRSNFGGKIFF